MPAQRGDISSNVSIWCERIGRPVANVARVSMELSLGFTGYTFTSPRKARARQRLVLGLSGPSCLMLVTVPTFSQSVLLPEICRPIQLNPLNQEDLSLLRHGSKSHIRTGNSRLPLQVFAIASSDSRYSLFLNIKRRTIRIVLHYKDCTPYYGFSDIR